MTEIVELWTAEALKQGDRVNITSLSENKEYIGKVKSIISQRCNDVGNWFNIVMVEGE